LIGFMADLAGRALGFRMSLHSNAGKERLFIIPFLLLSLIISAQILTTTCYAQSGYEIRNAIVTPEYGNEEFTYSAEVWTSEDVAGEVGNMAVTQFSLKLNIYNNGPGSHGFNRSKRYGKNLLLLWPL